MSVIFAYVTKYTYLSKSDDRGKVLSSKSQENKWDYQSN